DRRAVLLPGRAADAVRARRCDGSRQARRDQLPSAAVELCEAAGAPVPVLGVRRLRRSAGGDRGRVEGRAPIPCEGTYKNRAVQPREGRIGEGRRLREAPRGVGTSGEAPEGRAHTEREL